MFAGNVFSCWVKVLALNIYGEKVRGRVNWNIQTSRKTMSFTCFGVDNIVSLQQRTQNLCWKGFLTVMLYRLLYSRMSVCI